MSGVLILDVGAYSIKAGYASKSPTIYLNCITKAKSVKTRTFVSNQLYECADLSGLFFVLPFDRGYLLNWETQRHIWDYVLHGDSLNVSPKDTSLIVTQPYFNFMSIQEGIVETMFEEYEFNALYTAYPSSFAQRRWSVEHPSKYQCCLVVDSGYSFTHVVPYKNGQIVKELIRRINIGGKALTNHLKEIISYRQLMVMDETYVVNQMKEDVCFVSTDFNRDMNICRLASAQNTIRCDYVLPDFDKVKRGFIRASTDTLSGNEQVIRMNNERVQVPELLFTPSDIGLNQQGVVECIESVVEQMPSTQRAHFYGNILLTGGNCSFSGFKQRVLADVRAVAPAEFDVNVHCPDDPTTYAWSGAQWLAQHQATDQNLFLTRQLYDEIGLARAVEFFSL